MKLIACLISLFSIFTFSVALGSIHLNKLKVRTPANGQQIELAEGKCAYMPTPVSGDLLVVYPKKAKGFSFCVANAYCKTNGIVNFQRLYCNTVEEKCPADSNVCAADKFGDYADSK